MSSKSERRRRAYQERVQAREDYLRRLTYPWFCHRHGKEWPAATPIGLCGCLQKDSVKKKYAD